MKIKLKHFAAVGTFAFAVASSFGQVYWDSNGLTTGIGGNGSWSSAAAVENWNSNPVGTSAASGGGKTINQWKNNAAAVFGGTAGTVTMATGNFPNLSTSTPMTFNTPGYTLDLNGYNSTPVAGALFVTYSSNSTLNYSGLLSGNTTISFTGTSLLSFSTSDATAWNGKLILTNYTYTGTLATNEYLRFGTTNTGLGAITTGGNATSGFTLDPTKIAIFNGSQYLYAKIDSLGYISSSGIAIPEPSTTAMLAGAAILGLVATKRRRKTPTV